MRKFLLPCLVATIFTLFSPTASPAQWVLRGDGGGQIRIWDDTPCVHAGTLAQIREEHRGKFKKAEGVLGGQRLYGCWVPDEDGDPIILLENGVVKSFYMKSFKEDVVI